MRNWRRHIPLDHTAGCVTATPSRQKCPPCLMIFHVGQEQRRPGCFSHTYARPSRLFAVHCGERQGAFRGGSGRLLRSTKKGGERQRGLAILAMRGLNNDDLGVQPSSFDDGGTSRSPIARGQRHRAVGGEKNGEARLAPGGKRRLQERESSCSSSPAEPRHTTATQRELAGPACHRSQLATCAGGPTAIMLCC